MKRTTLHADPDVREYIALTKARTGQSGRQTLNDGVRLHAVLSDRAKLKDQINDYETVVELICDLAGIKLPS